MFVSDIGASVVAAFVTEKMNAPITAIMHPIIRTVLDIRFILNGEEYLSTEYSA